MSKLRNLLERVSDMIEEVYFDPNDTCLAHCIAENGAGEMLVAVCAPDFNVDLFREGVPIKAAKDGYFRSVFFSEAWMATMTDPEARQVAPQKHPERVEIFTLRAVNFQSRKEIIAYRRIDRLGEGEAKLGPLMISENPGRYYPAEPP